ACGRALANLLDSEYAARSAVQGRLSTLLTSLVGDVRKASNACNQLNTNLLTSLVGDVRKASNACNQGHKLTVLNGMAIKRATTVAGHVDLFAMDPALRQVLTVLNGMAIKRATTVAGHVDLFAMDPALRQGWGVNGFGVGTTVAWHVDLFAMDPALRQYVVVMLKAVAENDEKGKLPGAMVSDIMVMGVAYVGYRGDDQ
ncbi:hypothetical protein T484DRAFT_1807244, partial [Baffinella frigidus]